MADQDKTRDTYEDDRPIYEAPELILLSAETTAGGKYSFTNETTNGTTS